MLNTKQFIVTDPRTFDGNPYEVAERAVAQAEALLAVAVDAAEAAAVMARNAEMERQLERRETPDPLKFETGPHGKLFKQVSDETHKNIERLGMLKRAGGFDPKRPLGQG